MEILAIGAHPDDFELGCGGFLLKSKSMSHRAHLLLLTRGEGSGDGKMREAESIQSAESIGASNMWFGGYTDTELYSNGDLVKTIEIYVNMVKPRAHDDRFGALALVVYAVEKATHPAHP